jgi:hypothetical protein
MASPYSQRRNVQGKAGESPVRAKIVAIPRLSRRARAVLRIQNRRTGSAAIIPMPSRLRADMISQKELGEIRACWEVNVLSAHDIEKEAASIAERIRLGARIESGPDKFTHSIYANPYAPAAEAIEDAAASIAERVRMGAAVESGQETFAPPENDPVPVPGMLSCITRKVSPFRNPAPKGVARS